MNLNETSNIQKLFLHAHLFLHHNIIASKVPIASVRHFVQKLSVDYSFENNFIDNFDSKKI